MCTFLSHCFETKNYHCLNKCQVWWDNVQCLCLTKVGSRSRSQSKIKYCMTVFRVRSISFEPLVGFTNNFAQMSSMMRWCAVPMFDQGQGKKLTLFPMLHTGYSSPSVIALVYEFTFLYKKVWFHPVTYGGRHDCFRFQKHLSSLILIFVWFQDRWPKAGYSQRHRWVWK